jgi:hypothetical protein
MDADFQSSLGAGFEALIALIGQPITINGAESSIMAVLDDSTDQTALTKGGLEEQQVVTVTVYRSDYEQSVQTQTKRQMTVEAGPDQHLMVNEVRNNRALPYVVLECVRYRK